MAGCSGGEDGGWLGGWLQTVKDKSASAMEFVKNDLAEFTCTMHTDTRTIAHHVKEGINEEKAKTTTDKVRTGFAHILGGITKALTVPPDDSDEEEMMVGKNSVPVFDKAKVRLRTIQIDPGTYCNPPVGPPEKYKEWLETFDLDSHKGSISELLVSNTEMRALYTQLVPSEVSHAMFWQRYFYRLHHLQEDEARRTELKKRAEQAKTESIGWEDDWEDMAGPTSPRIPDLASLAEAQTTPRLKVETITPAVTLDQSTQEINERLGNVEPEEGESTNLDAKNNDFKNTQPAPEAAEAPVCDNSKIDIPNPEKIETVQTDPVESSQVLEAKDSDVPIVEMKSEETKEVELKEEAVSQTVEAVKVSQPTPVEVKSKVSGDMVVVGRDANTPTESCGSSNSKESSSLDDDWEKDFDIEVTEDDIKMAQEAAQNITLPTDVGKVDLDEDWENWD